MAKRKSVSAVPNEQSRGQLPRLFQELAEVRTELNACLDERIRQVECTNDHFDSMLQTLNEMCSEIAARDAAEPEVRSITTGAALRQQLERIGESIKNLIASMQPKIVPARRLLHERSKVSAVARAQKLKSPQKRSAI